MRKVMVKGEPYVAGPLRDADVRPGALVSGIFNRRAMRIVCLDGDDVILRNLRHPDLLEAEPLARMQEFWDRLEPLE